MRLSEFSSVAERIIVVEVSSSVVIDWFWALGAMLTDGGAETAMVIVSESVSSPSETVKVMVCVPIAEGVQEKVLVELLKEEPAGRAEVV